MREGREAEVTENSHECRRNPGEAVGRIHAASATLAADWLLHPRGADSWAGSLVAVGEFSSCCGRRTFTRVRSVRPPEFPTLQRGARCPYESVVSIGPTADLAGRRCPCKPRPAC